MLNAPNADGCKMLKARHQSTMGYLQQNLYIWQQGAAPAN